jgi:hypothetical protein
MFKYIQTIEDEMDETYTKDMPDQKHVENLYHSGIDKTII